MVEAPVGSDAHAMPAGINPINRKSNESHKRLCRNQALKTVRMFFTFPCDGTRA
jgi:hypothetical protein